MNRWIAILLSTLLAFCHAEAQISEGGTPPSFQYGTSLRSTVALTDIPVLFNVEDLLLVDEWQVANGSPLAVATSIQADLNTSNSGQWLTLPGGEKIWQLRIQAKDAIALMLYYKTFEIPEGGKLFLYNADKTHILGAYTHRTNPRGGRFATEFVAGDDLILEYVSAPSGNLPHIEIEEIGYGYNHLNILMGNNLRSSAACEVNINCPEGAAWQKEKAGVCHTIQKIGDKTYICTGSLVNNTALDFKPYVLMAYHCMESISTRARKTVSTPEDMKQWMFYFNYERQGCSASSPTVKRTMTGCTKVASTPIDKGGDGLLVLLDQEIPVSYNVYYNGWDRSNTAPLSGVGIHHPEGDYKKISTYTQKPANTTWYGTDSSTGARSAHWNVIFAQTENGHGITEGGSSGSPLFNQDHLVAGTLSGGNSSCSNPTGNNLYAKLYYNWDKHGDADSSRMAVWLDPKTTGVETLNGLSRATPKPEPTGLNLEYKNKSVTLSWTAPTATKKPTHYNVYRTNQLIGTTRTTSYTDLNPSLLGEVFYAVTAEYADKSESYPIKGSIVIQDFKAPTDLALSVDNSIVTLNWKAPVYTQAISWSANTLYGLLRINAPLYFGHYWEPAELASIANNTITAIELYATNKATYSLLLIQGSNRYTQAISSPQSPGIITAALTTPFVIDASKDLFVVIYVSDPDPTEGTIAIDEGPAMIGKGNIISEDAKEWFVLYDGNEGTTTEEDNLNYNLYLAAIVSSEKGTTQRMTAATTDGKEVMAKYPSVLHKMPYQGTTLKSFSTRATQFQYPTAFPEIKGYNVYRNGTLLTTPPIDQLRYTNRASDGTYTYGVSTVYAGGESEQVLSSDISVSNIEIKENQVSLYPTVFKEQVRIRNAYQVNRLEIYTVSGLLVSQINQPDEVINTNSLSPGIYFFRLYLKDEIKTIQTIKK
ncbi:T9SS type A sorting domain-containing protein [Massilibacteroides vaginae]|uniref:T9SS type A sorting domain-containing protein n=1 Tax=Massilibacteroides vaginae TaxID=1673718 RepID=UPI000A1CC23B|nr:T9SS type A sorting domain-containing protein [Massilibacteroides vaginae]